MPARGAGAAKPMLMAPAEARREARSKRQSPKAMTEEVEDLEARSQKFPTNLNRSPKCQTTLLVKDQSKRGSPKHESKPKGGSQEEVLMEVGILDFDATIYCKCQEHNSISKGDLTFFAKLKNSRRIFRFTWFQLSTNRTFKEIC